MFPLLLQTIISNQMTAESAKIRQNLQAERDQFSRFVLSHLIVSGPMLLTVRRLERLHPAAN